MRARLLELGMTVAEPNRPQEFGELIHKELAHWKQFAQTSPMRGG